MNADYERDGFLVLPNFLSALSFLLASGILKNTSSVTH